MQMNHRALLIGEAEAQLVVPEAALREGGRFGRKRCKPAKQHGTTPNIGVMFLTIASPRDSLTAS